MFTHVKHDALPVIEQINEEKRRVYKTPKGKIYPSVTTVIGIRPKPQLEAWIAEVGEEEAERVKVKAGKRGTAIHDMAERYLNNEKDYDKGHNQADKFTFSTIKPIIDKHIDNVWLSEGRLYSDYLKTAGTVDCVAEYDGRLSIIDFKTSLKLKKREWIDNYFMQEAFYAVAFEERLGKPVSQLVTIIAVDHEMPQIFIEKRDDWISGFMELRLDYNKLFGI